MGPEDNKEFVVPVQNKGAAIQRLQEAVDILEGKAVEVSGIETEEPKGHTPITALEKFINELAEPKEDGNLLEIRVKDIDSAPEVYYKGEPVYEGRLGSVSYLWEPGDYEEEGTHNIDIKGASVEDASWDTISKHKMRGD